MGRGRSRLRRRLQVGACCITLVILAGCTATPASKPGTPAASSQTRPATRADLTDTTTVTGTVGYGDSTDVAAELTGTLTRCADVGAVIGNGDVLYRLNDLPIIRFAGKLPAWRDLVPGIQDGKDIEQLERALTDLGYAKGLDLTVDQDWTWLTTIVVQRWQKAVGLDRTGAVPLGRIVFTPKDARVTQQLLDIGAKVAPGTAVLGLTATARTVAVRLKSNQANLAPVGGKARISLPDGSAAKARVSAVAAVPASDTDKDSTLAVTITSDIDDALKSLLDGTTVRVVFTKTVATNVLLVPVTALVALPDGSYGVQKAGSDGTTRTVKITPGRFSATMVEITDGDLIEGDKVVVTP